MVDDVLPIARSALLHLHALRTFALSRHACAPDDSRPEVSAAVASSAMRIAIGLRAWSFNAINHISPRRGTWSTPSTVRCGGDVLTAAGPLSGDGEVQPSIGLMTHSASATDCLVFGLLSSILYYTRTID